MIQVNTSRWKFKKKIHNKINENKNNSQNTSVNSSLSLNKSNIYKKKLNMLSNEKSICFGYKNKYTFKIKDN